MGLLQYLRQAGEALQGGMNELKQTSGGILKYLGNNINNLGKKKEQFYEPIKKLMVK